MKYIKRIGLFLFVAGIMFGAGSYMTLKAERFFYPNRYESNRFTKEKSDEYDHGYDYKSEKRADSLNNSGNKENGDDAGGSDDINIAEEQVIEAIVDDDLVVTADTIYLVEEINLADGTITEKEEPIPDKYIGLDRESLINELAVYESTPALSDLQKGFESIELTMFSKNKIVVCKYYRTEEEESGYYLMVEDHYVVVYEQDGETLYMTTEILLENLEESLQTEIIRGKYMEDEQSLYNFLESYSS